MATAELVNIEIIEGQIVADLQAAARKLDEAQGEAVLDFSSVSRVDSLALHALEQFEQQAEERSVKVVIRGTNIDIYKVLKLMKLTQRFSFID